MSAGHTEGEWLRPARAEITGPDDTLVCLVTTSAQSFQTWAIDPSKAKLPHAPEAEANARLIVAACNSYDRHFGHRAIEAAEADLLGKALEALRELADTLEVDCTCPPCEGSDAPAEHWLGVARRILSQAREVK